jgi:hypothetical protein
MSKRNSYHELAKNDPDFHDVRARVLLDAAQELKRLASEKFGLRDGILEAASELRRMASNARRAHKKLQDERENSARASAAKAKAFGFGD